ncbi:MAG: AAA family ATPase [Pseudonocardia sp.]|nr:AAA family ATPase [Pseudonocardia sp.]
MRGSTLLVSDTEQFRFEPTVFGAVRRYRLMVLAVVIASAVCGAGWALLQPDAYRAETSITVQAPASAQRDSNHVDAQVLLLQSQDVAARAADIVNTAREGEGLTVRDFSGDESALTITPPETNSPGTYGTGTIRVSFTWSNPQVAQLGANAMAQAFDEARSAATRSEGDATIAAIQNTIDDARNGGQRLDVLLEQRMQVLVNQQIDLANHPVVAWAPEPEKPVTATVRNSAAVGGLMGVLLGSLLAYLRAVRRGGFGHSGEPALLYRVPLLGEIPTIAASRFPIRRHDVAGLLPVATDPRSPAAEAFRFAAAAVEHGHPTPARDQRIAVISALQGSDRSVVVANLALALAEGGSRVLAVDAVGGTLSALLLDPVPDAGGLTQALTGQRDLADCIRSSACGEGLDVLGSGPEPSTRLAGEAYGRAIDKVLIEAESGYDVVLIDCPDLLRVATSTAVVDRCGTALLVVGPDQLARDHLSSVQRLDRLGTIVLGYVYLVAAVPSLTGRTLHPAPALGPAGRSPSLAAGDPDPDAPAPAAEPAMIGSDAADPDSIGPNSTGSAARLIPSTRPATRDKRRLPSPFLRTAGT